MKSTNVNHYFIPGCLLVRARGRKWKVSFSDRVGPPVCVAVADEIPPEVVFLGCLSSLRIPLTLCVRGSFDFFITVCSWQVSPLCCHLKFYFSLALVNQNPTHNLCAGLHLLFLDCEFGVGLSSVLPPEVFGFVGSHQSKSHAQFICRVILKFVYLYSRQISRLCCHLKFHFLLALVNQNPTRNLSAGLSWIFLLLDRGRPLVYVAEADKIPPAVSANLISMLILIWMIFYFLAKSRSACGFSLVCFPFIFPLWSLPEKSLSKPAGVQILDLWRDIALGMVCVTSTCVRVATVRSRPYRLTTHTQPSTDTHLPNMHAFLKKYLQPRTYWPYSPMHKHNHPHTCAIKITQLHMHTHYVYMETRALSHTKHALLNTCTFSQTQSATRTFTNTDTNTDQDTSYSP